ncbi:MAG: PKD domain-containing protein [Draconibacterium sp.]
MKKIILSIFSLTIILGLFYSCEDDIDAIPLEASFESDIQEVIAGELVKFNDLSAGNPSRWDWVFQGGKPSGSQLSSPSVTYDFPGSYKVTLTVGKKNDSTSISKEAFIKVGYGQVSTDFGANKTTVTQGESITFNDLSTGIPTSWRWEFIPSNGGEKLISEEQNPTITFEIPGTYSAKLTISNPASNDELIKNDWLTIIDASYVKAGIEAESQGTYTNGTIHFKDASLGTAKTWNWTFEGGTPASSTEQNPTITYSTPGRYNVKLTVSNDFTSDEKKAEDYVLVIPNDQLAAFYPLDGNGNDAGPNQVDASNLGGGTISFDQPDRKSVNSAAYFDGQSVLVAPDNDALNFGPSDFTIACWVKTDVTSRMMIWMESGGINGSGDKQAWLRIGDNTSDRKARFCVEDGTGSNILNSSAWVSDNSWHQVICVRKGTNSSLYVDGLLVLSKDTSTPKDVSSSQPFVIGGQAGSGGTYSNFFIGLIDELIVYNKALTLEEITELYNL